MEEETEQTMAQAFGESDCAAVIHRMAAGERAALLELYDWTAPLLYGLIQRILPGAGAAEEVLLDTFTAIWNHASEYPVESLAPFERLLTQARRYAIERLRADRPDLLLEGIEVPQAEPLPPAEALAMICPERQSRVREAMAALPPDQRQALELALFAGMGHGEIAAKTGQSTRVVRSQIRQAMIRLSDALQSVIGPPV